VPLGLASIVAAVVEIAFGHDTEGADGGEHPAFGAVDVVHTIAFSHWPALTPARQVEISRENISRLPPVIAVALTCSASVAYVALPSVIAIPIVPSIVPIPHVRLCSSKAMPASIPKQLTLREYQQRTDRSQAILGSFPLLSGDVGPSHLQPSRFARGP
jgi:hypothetical protein